MSPTANSEFPLESGQLADFSLEKPKKSSKYDLETLDQAGLLTLRAEIDSKLTGIRLKDLNLVQETLIQFQAAKLLQAKANEDDSDAPLNQRAQVQNSLANILASLAKTQSELHNSESVKRLKAATIKTLRQFPTLQDPFFEALGQSLEEAEREMGQ
jgi:hypothetical protein